MGLTRTSKKFKTKNKENITKHNNNTRNNKRDFQKLLDFDSLLPLPPLPSRALGCQKRRLNIAKNKNKIDPPNQPMTFGASLEWLLLLVLHIDDDNSNNDCDDQASQATTQLNSILALAASSFAARAPITIFNFCSYWKGKIPTK